MNNTSSVGGPFYVYSPSHALPIAFACMVSALLLIHIFLYIRYKWWHFGFMVTWASTVWIAGFVCRAISTYHLHNLGLYISQYILVLTGPVLFAAAEYFVLGRLLAYLPYLTPIHPGRVLSTFLFLSAAVEALTASGAAQIATKPTPADRKTGLALVKAALILQGVVEVSFFSLVALVERRCRKAGLFKRNIRIMCYVLYTTSFMVLVRCIFRAVEGFEESACPPTHYGCATVDQHEWFLWVFEVANITLFIIVLAAFHPGKYLPNNYKIFLDPVDGETERLGPGFSNASDRRFLANLVDPFDLSGMISGKAAERTDKFWEREQPVVETSRRGRRSKEKTSEPESSPGEEDASMPGGYV